MTLLVNTIINLESEYAECAEVWFALLPKRRSGATLTFGIDNGSRACTQSTSVELSEIWDPLPALIEFAREAVHVEVPASFEIDSEGPESVFSLQAHRLPRAAIFEVRDLIYPVIHFAAIVDPVQLGVALAQNIRETVLDDRFRLHWNEWRGSLQHQGDVKAYIRDTWLRHLPASAASGAS
jgi:hypothetical protein